MEAIIIVKHYITNLPFIISFNHDKNYVKKAEQILLCPILKRERNLPRD